MHDFWCSSIAPLIGSRRGAKKMILSPQKRSGTFWSQKSAIFLSLVFDRRFERCCPPPRVHRCTFDHPRSRPDQRDVTFFSDFRCWDSPLGELLKHASCAAGDVTTDRLTLIVSPTTDDNRQSDRKPIISPTDDLFDERRSLWQPKFWLTNEGLFWQPTIARKKTTKAEKDKFPNIILYDYQIKFVCLLNFWLFFSDKNWWLIVTPLIRVR